MAPNKPNTADKPQAKASILDRLSALPHVIRYAVYAALAAGTLQVVACNGGGDGETPDNKPDSGEDAGAAGAGGDGGGDPDPDAGMPDGGEDASTPTDECYLISPFDKCDDVYICEDDESVILARDIEAGATGSHSAPMPFVTDKSQLGVEINDTDFVQGEDSRLLLFRKAAASGYTTKAGETQLTQTAGYNANSVDRDDPINEGDCSVKTQPLGSSVRVTVTDVFATAYHEGENGRLDASGENGFESTVTETGTSSTLGSFSNVFFADTVPENGGGKLQVIRLLNGKIRVILHSEFTDEGTSINDLPIKLRMGGVELESMGGNVWETTGAVAGSLNLEVVGANGNRLNHNTDRVMVSESNMNVTVEENTTDLCEDVACDDGNACTEDSCNPDTGLCNDADPAPHEGDACDDADGGTIDDACQPDGSCAGTEVDCVGDNDCDDGDACDGTETCNLGTKSSHHHSSQFHRYWRLYRHSHYHHKHHHSSSQ